MTNGGDGLSGHKLSEEDRLKRTGINNCRYGKKHSEQTKLKFSEDRKGEKNHRFGKQTSESVKRKLSESKKLYYTTHEVYNKGTSRSNEVTTKIVIVRVKKFVIMLSIYYPRL